MTVEIIRSGIFDTVQDLGRTGYRSSGVNPGGAADRAAVRILNTLLGNDETAPVIESHFPGPELRFASDTLFAVGGADLSPALDGVPVSSWAAHLARKGSSLAFRRPHTGVRTYVAVEGGFDADRWLGSAATNLFIGMGGFDGRRLKAGDKIETTKPDGRMERTEPLAAGPGVQPTYSPVLRVTEGPEFHRLTAEGGHSLLTSGFTVGPDSDRMGLRLTGPRISLLNDRGLLSAAVCPGTVQLLPDGNPLVLGADCQTTGGYPRVLNVIDADLPSLAQLGSGSKIRFRPVTEAEAFSALLRFEKDLCFLRMGIRFRTS